METFDPNKNHIFYYTNECAMCGHAVLDDAGQLREEIQKAGYFFTIKEVPLFHGWKAEAKAIGEELPFFYNYDTQTVAKYDVLIKDHKRTTTCIKVTEEGREQNTFEDIRREVRLDKLKEFLSRNEK